MNNDSHSLIILTNRDGWHVVESFLTFEEAQTVSRWWNAKPGRCLEARAITGDWDMAIEECNGLNEARQASR